MHPFEQGIRAIIGERYSAYGNALLAVLDLHQPEADDPGLCCCCFNAIEEQYEYPCPTVNAIADALGVDSVDVQGWTEWERGAGD